MEAANHQPVRVELAPKLANQRSSLPSFDPLLLLTTDL